MLKIKEQHIKWYFLVMGSACILLSGPVFQIALAGWFVPVGIFYFILESKPMKGYLWAVLVMTIFIAIGSLHSSVLPPVATLISAVISAFLDALPYLVVRVLYKRIGFRYSIFLLPVVCVSYEYLLTFSLSSIGVLGGTQVGFAPLIQLASITGIYGVSFMLYWGASVFVAFQNDKRGAIRYVKEFAYALVIILIFGLVKPRIGSSVDQTVKVAGIVVEEFPLFEQLYSDFFNESITFDITTTSSPEMAKVLSALSEFIKTPDDKQFIGAHEVLEQFQNRIIEITEREARNGNKIIVWSETNMPVFQKDEEELKEKVSRIARQYQVIILTSSAVLLPYEEDGPMYENKSLMFMPDGNVVDEYEKARPVPFLDKSLPGDGILEIINTPYGKLTNAICYDGDFPDLIKQSGNADILLLPANDWLGISPFHSEHAVFRAIENGVSIVRPTGTGQSIIFDSHGNVLARQDAFDKTERIINANIPTSGTTTIFNYIGNSFAWICLISAVVLIGFSFTNPVRSASFKLGSGANG